MNFLLDYLFDQLLGHQHFDKPLSVRIVLCNIQESYTCSHQQFIYEQMIIRKCIAVMRHKIIAKLFIGP